MAEPIDTNTVSLELAGSPKRNYSNISIKASNFSGKLDKYRIIRWNSFYRS